MIKMKKINIIFVIVMSLVIVSAGIGITNDIIVEKGNKAVLETMNIGDNIEIEYVVCVDTYDEWGIEVIRTDCHTEIEITNLEHWDETLDGKIRRCISQEHSLQPRCSSYYELEEDDLRNLWERNELNRLANNKKIRDSKSEPTRNKQNVTIEDEK